MIVWKHACLAWDSLLLFVICTADMCSTLYWVHTGALRRKLIRGWPSASITAISLFAAAKLLSFLPLLAFAAYYRPRRPRLIAVSLRATIALYAVIYLLAVGGQWV